MEVLTDCICYFIGQNCKKIYELQRTDIAKNNKTIATNKKYVRCCFTHFHSILSVIETPYQVYACTERKEMNGGKKPFSSRRTGCNPPHMAKNNNNNSKIYMCKNAKNGSIYSSVA